MFNLVKEILEAAIVALVVFFLIDTSVQSFKVEGVSMAPTLQPGQYLVVNKLEHQMKKIYFQKRLKINMLILIF